MKPNQLHAFVAVVEQMSIRAAARVLGISQPAVTKIVRELEREVDAPLVERSVKGVQNVYTQHTPYLGQILEKLSKGVLAETLYPYLPSAEAAAGAGAKKAAPTQILVRTTPRPRPQKNGGKKANWN